MEKIKIRTGSNLSPILQSTVNIPQAFTELVKNSIQNLSTIVSIEIKNDTILIADNGIGFNYLNDSDGKNDFDRYFVFGNSYDATRGEGLRLGHMGLGGKLSNDKLSKAGAPNWSLHTKNKTGEAFIVNYNPPKSEFLDDYSPEIQPVNSKDSLVNTTTGTTVVINDVNDIFHNNNRLIHEIKEELRNFFGTLVASIHQEGKNLEVIFNGESLNFDYRLPGISFTPLVKSFSYDYYGEEKTSEITFNLSYVKTREFLKDHPVQNVQIVSNVKISDLCLSNSDLLDLLTEDEDEKLEIINLFYNTIGYVSCPDLSSVLDDSGMPAKDLSHHSLRSDHPITTAFLQKTYEVIIDLLRAYKKLKRENEFQHFNNFVSQITDFLKSTNMLSEDMLVTISKPSKKLNDVERSASSAIRNAREFNPKNKTQKDRSNWETEVKASENYLNQEIIDYNIIDFGEGNEEEMSKHLNANNFQILINSTNYKYQKVNNSKNPLFIMLHLSECLISEMCTFYNPSVTRKEIEKCVANFYKNYFDEMLTLVK